MPLSLFWKPRHAWLALALAVGIPALARGRMLLALAAIVPWARAAAPSYGGSPRGVARAVAELPRAAVLDVAEMTAVARGAIDARTPLL